MKEKSTLNIPASVKYVSESPYAYFSSNTVKVYGNKASSNLLSNPAIKDVYFYDPECDLNNCYINRVYNGIIVSASKENNQKAQDEHSEQSEKQEEGRSRLDEEFQRKMNKR